LSLSTWIVDRLRCGGPLHLASSLLAPVCILQIKQDVQLGLNAARL
jgi:hypothetical protein